MARITPYDRSTTGRSMPHRLAPHALDEADDPFAGDDNGDGPHRFDPHHDQVAPLRYDSVPGDAPDAARDYASPRLSLWRMLRVPVVVTAIALALLVATWTTWDPLLRGISESTSALAEREGDGRTRETVSVGIGALAVLAFVATWWRGSHPRRPVRLADGRGTIGVDAIAGQLRTAILDLPEVRVAEVAVENRGGGQVRVRTWLRVTAEARIDDALDGVDAAADWLVHHRLGLMLSEPPLAEVRYDELNLRPTRASSGAGMAGRPYGERND